MYRPLGEKLISFPCFTEHVSFLSCCIMTSEYHLEALKDHLTDRLVLCTYKVTTQSIYFS